MSKDVMQSWEESQARLKAMPFEKREQLRGMIRGLLFAQAQDPHVDDHPLVVDFLHYWFDFEFEVTVQDFRDALWDEDDEGGIVYTKLTEYRYSPKAKERYVKLHIGGSEGKRGVPEDGWWDDQITDEEAQKIINEHKERRWI